MKCIECGKDSSKKDRGVSGGRCSSCYHAFVTEPLEDGLTDMAIKSAVDTVSSNGTLYFSKDNLRYQLQRKLNKKIKLCSIALVVLVVIFIALLVFAFIARGAFVVLTLVSAATLLVPLVAKARFKTNISKLPALVDKWLVVNPHEKRLTAEKSQANTDGVSTANLDDISFDRVLICERDETVDFFLSNLFHFHYSCPVLGGSGYPKGIYEDMLRRLKQNPNVKVFLLHDHSPAGIAFARRIKTDPKWFGGQRYTIVDLGLNGEQKKLFKDMTFRFVDRNKKVKETAEVALFAPAALIGLCGAAINEGVPFDLVTSVAAAASGSNGYG
ncbi:MAG: hypothetical protein QX189_13420 [Methylococcales bacterium]